MKHSFLFTTAYPMVKITVINCFKIISEIKKKTDFNETYFTIWKKPGGDCIVYVASCLDGCKRCWWLIAIF